MPDSVAKYLNKTGLETYNESLPHSPTQMQTYVDDWLDEHPEATTTVQDDSITAVKLADGSVPDAKLVQTGGVLDRVALAGNRAAEAYPYTNLFDKDSVNRRDDVYVYYLTGNMESNAEYASYVIPVIAGRKISGYMLKFAHITFYSDYPDIQNTIPASGVPVGSLIDSFSLPAAGTFDGYTISATAKYMVVSCHVAANQLPYTVIQYSDTNAGNDGYTRDAFGIGKALAGKLDAYTGKNILDLQSNAKSGFYANGYSGRVEANASYGMALVRVNAGEVLSFNSYCNNAHVAFLSAWQSLENVSAGTVLAGYISGFANEAMQNYTVPDGAVAMVFSYPLSRANLVQVERASASTSYEAYWKGLPLKAVRGILTVGTGMEYATISDAVAKAGENDIVLVFPGVYTETVKAWGKYVNIIGMSRDACILTHGGGDYTMPPLEMSHGVLANMTIHTTYEETTGSAPAYCMHVEDNSAAGSSFYVSNVRFINDKHQTVGIGLRNDYTLTFENCVFENTSENNALYCHDHETRTTYEDNQSIQLIDCVLRNDSTTKATIALQSQEIEGNRATLTTQRCIVRNAANGPEISMVKWQGRDQGGGNFLDSTDWLLSDISALNTLATINA